MDRIIKCPKRQDCHYKLSPGSSGETSINLSNEVFQFLFPSGAPTGTPIDIAFRVFKSDAIKALCFIVGKLPLYKTSSSGSTVIEYNTDFFTSQYDIISSFFGDEEEADYHVKLLYREDGRIYLNGLDDNDFNIRHYLVESNTVLVFSRENDTLFLRLEFGTDLFEKYSVLSAAHHGEIVVAEKKLRNFILECVKVFSKIDGLESVKGFVANPIQAGYPIKIASNDHGFSLTGMFIETTKENLEERNAESERWYSEEFVLDGHTVYLSTQWNATGDYQLTLNDFLVMMNVCYPGRFTYSQEGKEFVLRKAESQLSETSKQKIFFGTPGSGKSYKVNSIVRPFETRTFRVTFHPDTDYASFVGSYKPVKDGTAPITYEFVPQAFTDAYVKAWEDTSFPVFLVIEEINRGNCAQIFGDLFQLLDRDEKGFSEYNVNADKDLRKYLERKDILGEDHPGIKNGKLCLPSNLYIFATMNTSDQSLFPMDSAFKRRWQWEYVPIQSSNSESQFFIAIGDKKYPWKDFLEAVNGRIKDVSESEDKQMGNFFIKNNISEKEFVSKVMFYLWSEVCKEEYHARSFFHYKDGVNDEFSFNDLFRNQDAETIIDTEILQGFMKFLKVDGV